MEQIYIFVGIVVALIIVVTPFVILDIKKRDRKIEAVFAERQELNERDFYEKYFEQKGVPFFIVQIVRQILERELSADLSRLSAADDFSKNLSFFWQYDSLADVEIVESIEEEFQIELTAEDLQNQFRTVDGIVDLVWRKVREKKNFKIIEIFFKKHIIQNFVHHKNESID